MNPLIRHAASKPPPGPGPVARLLRALILLGVWALVGLSALTAWSRLA